MSRSQQKFDAIFNTDLATIGIQLSGDRLTRVEYLGKQKALAPTSKVAKKYQSEIVRLIKGKPGNLQIKVDISRNVSPLQKKFLDQLMKIP